MTTFSAMFSMIIGLYLWILTLKTKDDFAPLWMAQPAAVQDLMEMTVSYCSSNHRQEHHVSNKLTSSPAAAT
jgi:hypothetical protein